MLMPKRTKYRKQQKGRRKGLAHRGSDVSFGEYGLQTLEGAWLSARQIEAGRMAIQRATKRAGRLFIRVFPDKPLTKKPLETRMGHGKGSVEEWVCLVQPGRMLYELEGVTEDIAREAFKLAGIKLPLPTRFMKREEQL
jgi:large subunit ribosomal protein L16